MKLYVTFVIINHMKLNGNFLTISDIAEELGITYETAKQRLFRAGIKPLTSDVIYPASALEAIRNVPSKGRPKKDTEPEPAKPKAKKPLEVKK